MSCFRWCSGYWHPALNVRVVHLLSDTTSHGDPCPGSYPISTPLEGLYVNGVQQSHTGFAYCSGTIIVPTREQQDALHAAWKMGGHEGCAVLMEQFAGARVQRPTAGWSAVDTLRKIEGW